MKTEPNKVNTLKRALKRAEAILADCEASQPKLVKRVKGIIEILKQDIAEL